uniref:Putative ovule protein n=1 Tax=Solanum chacoense TaxID=4108 RepID=A0A0V0IGW9_SOLCH
MIILIRCIFLVHPWSSIEYRRLDVVRSYYGVLLVYMKFPIIVIIVYLQKKREFPKRYFIRRIKLFMSQKPRFKRPFKPSRELRYGN